MNQQQASAEEIQERTAIDRSARYPVLFFFTSGAAWLFVATALGLASALKLRNPGLFDDWGLLAYGRLYPAHMTALVYGWAMQAGLGVMLWIMARLTRCPVRHPVAVLVSGHIWNVAVTLAVLSVWFGFGRSIPWLDFPSWLWPVFAISYGLVAVWVLPMFRFRRGDAPVFVSEKFLFGAALWFPWIFLTANFLIGRESAPVMGAGAGAWYMSNLIYFWMAPIALAVAHYLTPKISGRPVASTHLANLSFWVLAALAGWTGFARFMGGPFPAWMPAVSGAAAIFILLAVVAVVANLGTTLKGTERVWEYSPSLRFTVFGVLMLGLYALLSAVSSTLSLGGNLQFSYFVVGLDTLAVYGFFSMSMFGAIYFIVPRITGAEWPSAAKIRSHFWFSVYGILTLVICMLVGGIAQAGYLAQWDKPFSTTFINTSSYVIGAAIAWILIAYSNIWFFYQLALMFVGKGRKSEGPTLLHVTPGSAGNAAEIARSKAQAAEAEAAKSPDAYQTS